MPLKKASGNMYTWVTHIHTHLGGECDHRCRYCYVKSGRAKNAPRYQGPTRLLEQELTVNYGVGEKIMALTAKLHEYGIELREKHNLARLRQR